MYILTVNHSNSNLIPRFVSINREIPKLSFGKHLMRIPFCPSVRPPQNYVNDYKFYGYEPLYMLNTHETECNNLSTAKMDRCTFQDGLFPPEFRRAYFPVFFHCKIISASSWPVENVAYCQVCS